MPLPLAALAIGAGVQGVAKIAQGISQKNKAKNLKESTFIPPAVLEAERLAKQQENATRYAGQDVDETNIRQGTATGISNVNKAATSSADALNMGSAIVGREQNQMRQLGKTLQMFKEQGRQSRRQALTQKAFAQARNKQQFEAAKSGLKGAATQNIYGGVSDLAGGLVSALGGSGKKPNTNLDAINQGGWG
jgi:hypothetical protein